MSTFYPTNTENREEFFNDLLYRKEFYELKREDKTEDAAIFDKNDNTLSIFDGKVLNFQGQQLFCRNFMSINTPYKRLLIKHGTGTGKTLAALSIAEEFIAEYRGIYASAVAAYAASIGRRQFGIQRRATIAANNTTPTVIILGFGGTKTAFIKELFRWPEFGYLSTEDRQRMVTLRREAESGDPAKIKLFKENYSSLKRRITEKARGGFYKFYGYQEFVNRIFLIMDGDIDLLKIEREAMASAKNTSGTIKTLESILEEYIAAGKIKLNTRLLAQLEHSIVICDEAHNLYNSFMKNNYGIAVQYLLDNVPTLRGVLVSATPINSPGEIVDLLNLLSGGSGAKKLERADIFKNITTPRELLNGAEGLIISRTFGRVSFLQDFSKKYYPERRFLGESLADIPYLKFIKCKMPKAHIAGYKKMLAERAVKNESQEEAENPEEVDIEDAIINSNRDKGYIAVPGSAYTIYDMVFPAKDDGFIFRSQDINAAMINDGESIENSSNQYFYGVPASNKGKLGGMKARGEFLKSGEIGKWSGKYAALLAAIDDVFAEGKKNGTGAKVMIYHNRVRLSGVLLIEELLRANGIIDEFSPPADDTRCSICGEPSGKHSGDSGKNVSHKYVPARYIIAHNMIDKMSLDRSIAKYISPDNAYGINVKFIIGSKIIRESYDIKDTRYQFIMSEPINMPILIQILGRCIRKNSHINLPPELRNVTIGIFINMLPSQDDKFVEEIHYIEKMKDYLSVQKIESVINSYAIDSNFYRAEIGTTFGRDKDGEPIDSLDLLYFEPAISFKPGEVTTTTFEAYGHGRDEVKDIIAIIKKLFYERPVFTYDELWAAVTSSEQTAANPALFSEDNFIIALSFLVPAVRDDIGKIHIKTSLAEQNSLNDDTEAAIWYLFNKNNRFIYKNGQRFTIKEIGENFILFPIDNSTGKEIVDFNAYILNDNIEHNYKTSYSLSLKDIKQYDKNYEIERDNFKKRFCGKTDLGPDEPFFLSFVSEYSQNFQQRLLHNAIRNTMLSSATKSTMATSSKNISDSTLILYKKMLEVFDSFGFLLRLSDLDSLISAAVKREAFAGMTIARGAVVGYIFKGEAILFVSKEYIKLKGAAGSTKKVTDITFNDDDILVMPISIKQEPIENDYIIGFSEIGVGGRLIFKIRRSITSYGAVLKGKSRGQGGQIDLRILDRGINCIYKSKEELVKIAKGLNISIADVEGFVSKMQKGAKIKIKHLCFAVRDKLLRLEMSERKKGTNKKWFYLWWDKVPDLLN